MMHLPLAHLPLRMATVTNYRLLWKAAVISVADLWSLGFEVNLPMKSILLNDLRRTGAPRDILAALNADKNQALTVLRLY